MLVKKSEKVRIKKSETLLHDMQAVKSNVTVVIPCYNAAPFLRATLESVMRQTHTPFEVLVIDDGSTDQSAAIARSFGSPLRVISQTNQGESIARNRGIDEAKGDWIAFLDADDLWLPNKLERQLAAVKADVVCVHTNYKAFGTCKYTRDLSKIPPAKRYSLERFFLGYSSLTLSTLMVSRSLPARFPTWTQYAEDAIYFAEVSRLGKMALMPEILTAVRCHPTSQSAGAGIAAHWHETFLEWLRRNEQTLDARMVGSLRRKLLKRLVHQSFKAYYKCKWNDYRLLRDYLARYADDPSVKALLDGRIPPRWFYTLRQGLGQLIAS
jgi:glycosyltransferase involved in cell wall biosynthesis